MNKMIRTTIDGDGNVSVDLAGFSGDDCAAEERRLRDRLAAFGLQMETVQQQRKPATNTSSATLRQRIAT